MKGLHRIYTAHELNQFITLHDLLSQLQLMEQPDDIWCFTSSGNYSVQSSYIIQFSGSFADHD
jgi:hypothetical protein